MQKMKNFYHKIINSNNMLQQIYLMLAPPACELLKIEISANCNADCVWCWMNRSPKKPRGFMRLDDFKRIIDLNKDYLVKQRTRISLYFNGECFIHPQIFQILDYVVSNNLLLGSVDTNMGMKIDIKKLMSYPFPNIVVSIGGTTKDVHEAAMGTSFDLVTGNLRRMFEIDKSRVRVKLVPTKSNVRQIKELGNFVEMLGGDPSKYIIADTAFMLPALATDEDRETFFNNVVSEEVKEHLRFDFDVTKEGYGIKSKRPGCYFPIDCIHYNGRFTACCHDLFGKINAGNAFEAPIKKIKKSKQYRLCKEKARNMAFYFCKECN